MGKKLSANKRAVVEWLATNRFERAPATQKALADKLGIHEVTVSKWKRQFSEEVNDAAKAKMREALPDVIASLIEQAKGGSYQHQKLYFEMVGEYTQRQEITGADGGPVEHEVNVRELSDDELQQLIED